MLEGLGLHEGLLWVGKERVGRAVRTGGGRRRESAAIAQPPRRKQHSLLSSPPARVPTPPSYRPSNSLEGVDWETWACSGAADGHTYPHGCSFFSGARTQRQKCEQHKEQTKTCPLIFSLSFSRNPSAHASHVVRSAREWQRAHRTPAPPPTLRVLLYMLTPSTPPAPSRRASQPRVALGVALALALTALPFFNKTVRSREAAVAAMRDASYAKDEARNARLSVKQGGRGG